MGHGNGWPSKYRDALYPPTQNGFGLNPKAGGGDYTHQYFGEASVGGQVKLAKNAVVLLNHLCYASGNTEPGLPEGNLAQAKQRVDNYAAGLHPGRRVGGHRRGVVEPVVLRQDHPVEQPLDPERLVERPEREPPPAGVQERAQQGLRRADGHRDRDIRVHALGRDEDRPGARGTSSPARPVRRDPPAPRTRHRSVHPARADPDRDRSSSWGRRTSSGCRRPGPRATSTSRSRSRIGRHSRRASRPASVGIRSTSRSHPQTRPTRSTAPLPRARRRLLPRLRGPRHQPPPPRPKPAAAPAAEASAEPAPAKAPKSKTKTEPEAERQAQGGGGHHERRGGGRTRGVCSGRGGRACGISRGESGRVA